MTTLYIGYDSTRWEERAPDPDDPWDAGNYGGDYRVAGVFLSGGMRDYHETPEDIKAGDTVHVVYISYYSGSTFGTQGGYGDIIAVTWSIFPSLIVAAPTES